MYPYTREWSVDSININRYKAIKDNWEDSRKCINDIRERLKQSESKISSEVITIAAAGSMGRMEANRGVSDADLIILLSDNIELDSQEATEIYNSIWEILNPLKLERPKATGVFAKPINQKQLLSSIGKADEEYATYGKRLLLLLETQPLYRDASYTQVINAIIERYADKYVKQDSKKRMDIAIE
ncbi:MAG: nucleotidyltransferase domain-containing protein [Desertifilum sp.]|nr:nucleotidyltransferase domain-containing protein [Desertifilum sp.]